MVKVWSFEFEKEIAMLQGHSGPVYSVAFSADGKFLASGS
jgi:WD40 repeat protein